MRRNGLIVDAMTTRASGHAERLAAIALIEPRADRPNPITLGADKAYRTADFVMQLREHTVTPHLAQNQSGRRSAIDGRTRPAAPSRPPILAATPTAQGPEKPAQR